MTLRFLVSLLCALLVNSSAAQTPPTAPLLQPDRVFADVTLHDGWVVLVRGERIEAVGPAASVPAPAGARSLRLAGQTVLPGLIEGHSHLLLHPCKETPWNDQVAREPLAYRVARAVVHAERTLLAGVTTMRDLGTEGAAYADVVGRFGVRSVDAVRSGA
jgi:imidazolonepropionase-like amidohydrolase